jgi:hypothetical protein
MSATENTDWAELGREIARKMAEAWGAEWRSHSWDAVEYEPLFQAAAPQLEKLWGSEQEDEYYRLKDLCRNAWQEELSERLQYKRGTRLLSDILEGSDRHGMHLQLTGHATITGSISTREDGIMFSFRLTTRGAEKTIALPENAEFARESSAKRQHYRTGWLQLRHESSGYRHYLGSRDVHCGRGVTLVLPDNSLIEGRYECSLRGEDSEPLFYFSLAGGIDGTDRVLRMPYDADFLLSNQT